MKKAFCKRKLFAVYLGSVGLAFGAGIVLVARWRAAKKIAHFVGTDPLTGGRSFARFQAEAEETLANSDESEFAVLAFDVDRFKDFNDAYGCAEGDRLILALDKVLDAFEGPDEMHAHVSGDRFVMLLRWEGVDEFTRRFTQLDKDVNRIEVLSKKNCRILCFGGIAVFDGVKYRRSAINELVDRARFARGYVGESSKSTFVLYTKARRDRDVARRALQATVVDALANGEFVPFYQPKVVVGTGEVVGFEVLARWRVSADEVLAPACFIDALEESGLVATLDLSMFRQACAFLRRRIAEGLHVVPLACNFSRVNLRDNNFVSMLLNTAAEYGVPCELLELELTESAVMEDIPRAIVAGNAFKAHGFRLAIDDFGSGYSSLGALQKLPADVLKIDRSLLVSGSEHTRSGTVFESVVAMADKLGLSVVAEGVETAEQAAWLADLNPHIVVQGYICSPPVTEEEAVAYLDGKDHPLCQ